MSNCPRCNYIVGHSSGCPWSGATPQAAALVKELIAEGVDFNRAANQMWRLAEDLEEELTRTQIKLTEVLHALKATEACNWPETDAAPLAGWKRGKVGHINLGDLTDTGERLRVLIRDEDHDEVWEYTVPTEEQFMAAGKPRP